MPMTAHGSFSQARMPSIRACSSSLASESRRGSITSHSPVPSHGEPPPLPPGATFLTRVKSSMPGIDKHTFARKRLGVPGQCSAPQWLLFRMVADGAKGRTGGWACPGLLYRGRGLGSGKNLDQGDAALAPVKLKLRRRTSCPDNSILVRVDPNYGTVEWRLLSYDDPTRHSVPHPQVPPGGITPGKEVWPLTPVVQCFGAGVEVDIYDVSSLEQERMSPARAKCNGVSSGHKPGDVELPFDGSEGCASTAAPSPPPQAAAAPRQTTPIHREPEGHGTHSDLSYQVSPTSAVTPSCGAPVARGAAAAAASPAVAELPSGAGYSHSAARVRPADMRPREAGYLGAPHDGDVDDLQNELDLMAVQTEAARNCIPEQAQSPGRDEDTQDSFTVSNLTMQAATGESPTARSPAGQFRADLDRQPPESDPDEGSLRMAATQPARVDFAPLEAVPPQVPEAMRPLCSPASRNERIQLREAQLDLHHASEQLQRLRLENRAAVLESAILSEWRRLCARAREQQVRDLRSSLHQTELTLRDERAQREGDRARHKQELQQREAAARQQLAEAELRHDKCAAQLAAERAEHRATRERLEQQLREAEAGPRLAAGELEAARQRAEEAEAQCRRLQEELERQSAKCERERREVQDRLTRAWQECATKDTDLRDHRERARAERDRLQRELDKKDEEIHRLQRRIEQQQRSPAASAADLSTAARVPLPADSSFISVPDDFRSASASSLQGPAPAAQRDSDEQRARELAAALGRARAAESRAAGAERAAEAAATRESQLREQLGLQRTAHESEAKALRHRHDDLQEQLRAVEQRLLDSETWTSELEEQLVMAKSIAGWWDWWKEQNITSGGGFGRNDTMATGFARTDTTASGSGAPMYSGVPPVFSGGTDGSSFDLPGAPYCHSAQTVSLTPAGPGLVPPQHRPCTPLRQLTLDPGAPREDTAGTQDTLGTTPQRSAAAAHVLVRACADSERAERAEVAMQAADAVVDIYWGLWRHEVEERQEACTYASRAFEDLEKLRRGAARSDTDVAPSVGGELRSCMSSPRDVHPEALVQQNGRPRGPTAFAVAAAAAVAAVAADESRLDAQALLRKVDILTGILHMAEVRVKRAEESEQHSKQQLQQLLHQQHMSSSRGWSPTQGRAATFPTQHGSRNATSAPPTRPPSSGSAMALHSPLAVSRSRQHSHRTTLSDTPE